MPEIPDPSLPPPAEPSPAQPGPDEADEASLRLLLDALVRRLNSQPQELAERALGREGERGPSSTPQ